MTRFVGSVALIAIFVANDWSVDVVQAQPPLPTQATLMQLAPPAITWHHDLASGWRESKRTGRPMVIFITSPRCRYCDAMKAGTWRDVGIENRVGSEFIAVQLTPEHNPIELSRISVDVYPTTLIALPQGKVIDHRTGFQPPALLHNLLNRATRG
jgi:thioredoxin-related protein